MFIKKMKNLKNNKKILFLIFGVLIFGSGATGIILHLTRTKSDSHINNRNEVVVNKLVASSFATTGVNGKATISKRSDVIFPEQVEFKYYQGKKTNPTNDQYDENVPRNLINGDNVKIKFFIKTKYQSTHQFPSSFVNPITITISGRKVPTNVEKTDIEKVAIDKAKFVGFTSKIKKLTLANGFFLVKDTKSYIDGLLETKTPPSTDGVTRKYEIVSNSPFLGTVDVKVTFTSEATSDTTNFKINGFLIDNTGSFIFLKEDFLFEGKNGEATIKRKIINSDLPSETELRYYQGEKTDPIDAQYSKVVPTKLKNGDKVIIKLFIKKEHISTHGIFFEKKILIIVKGLSL